MRNALPPGPDGARRWGMVCACCGREIVLAVEGVFVNQRRGSSRRFCSPGCRQAARRRRKAGVVESAPLQHLGGRGRHLAHTQEDRPGTHGTASIDQQAEPGSPVPFRSREATCDTTDEQTRR